MELHSVHAYSVAPSSDRAAASYQGGPIELDDDIKFIITTNIQRAKFNQKLTVDFRFDADRKSPVRKMVKRAAFGNRKQAAKASNGLAERLLSVLDGRSKPGLFLVVRHGSGDERQVTLWLFPREEALRIKAEDAHVSLSVLKDIFSNTSNLRKAARFLGKDTKTGFIQGNILDFQSLSAMDGVARLWIDRFLDCQQAISDESANRLVGKALQELSKKATTPEEQRSIGLAATAIRDLAPDRTSIEHIVENYIPQTLRERFKSQIGRPEILRSEFRKDVQMINSIIGKSEFLLENGVAVVTPLSEIGASVVLEGDGGLQCSGQIMRERLKANAAITKG